MLSGGGRAVRPAHVASILAVGGLAGLLAGCGVLGPTQEEQRTYTISEQVTKLVVVGDAIAIKVVVGEGQVKIDETVRWRTDKPETTRSVEGGSLRITDRGGCTKVSNACEVKLTVTVPATTAVDLDIDAGRVVVNDVSGDLRVRLDAGDLE